ncbi:MAG: hypothetical protein GY941_21630 [Planctomycetes bacterium]|nr:hypothetical protein [Planctomycetota bacterium]
MIEKEKTIETLEIGLGRKVHQISIVQRKFVDIQNELKQLQDDANLIDAELTDAMKEVDNNN